MRVKSNLDEIIYDKITDALILGEYNMGQMILLDAFAEKYEVSRTPVIQAVKLLASDGILEIMKNGRVMVPYFDRTQMEKICEIRLVLEEHAIRRIQKMSTPSESFYEELMDIAERGVAALQAGDKLKFNKRDLEFHRKLISACGNEYLTAEYKRIQGKFLVANYLMKPLEERDFEAAAQSHVELTESLKQGDLKNSLKIIKEHIFSFATAL